MKITFQEIKNIIQEIVDEARIYGGGDHGISTSTEYTLTPEEQESLKNMTPKQRQQFSAMKLKQARRNKGQCASCGKSAAKKPNGTIGTYCDDHLNQFRSARGKLAQKRGSCTRCPNPPLPGQKLCKSCTDELALGRYKALAAGLCLRCKKEPADVNEKGRKTLFCKACNKTKSEVEKQRKFNLNLQNPSQ